MRLRMQQWYTFIFYGLSLAFTKMAILLLYMRILIVGYVRLASYVVLAAVVICNVWVLVSLLLQCIPLQAAWDLNVKGWCFPPELTGLINSVLHVITDFAIFALPIPALSTLKMARNQKICVIALFGAPQRPETLNEADLHRVCIISVIRIIYLRYVVDFVDATYGMSSMAIWGSVEVNMAIICACAATFKPLVNKWFPHAMDTSSAGMTQPSLVAICPSTARQETRNDIDGKDRSFVRLQELEHADAQSKSSLSDLEYGFGSQGSRAFASTSRRARS
ncbi:hypothetical protein N0V88_004914 [Collariella sp. IMI 366227]|nr:hypothetical protein N0V88_004914 [Collariella sp. IMI 366227]